mgnify:CR=1 FL=1
MISSNATGNYAVYEHSETASAVWFTEGRDITGRNRMNIYFKPYFCISAYTEGRLTPSNSAVRVMLYPVFSSV